MTRAFLLVAAALAAPLAGCQAATPAGTEAGAPILTRAPLAIETIAGRRDFTVEIARSAAEQARGLMYRTRLGEKEGMLFPFDPPRPTAFWMKDTLIPLDMIFIRADGTIARIAARTVPQSLDPVESGEPVAAVLEIAGGLAERLGVREGDRVILPPMR